MFELFKYSWVVLVVLSLSGQLGKLRNVVVNVASFHFQLVKFCCGFVVGISVVPVLNKVLFKFLPDVNMGGSRYGPPHDPIFYASLPFGNGASLYEGKCMCHLSVWVGHDWCGGVEELVKFEFVHELVGSGSISSECGRFLSF